MTFHLFFSIRKIISRIKKNYGAAANDFFVIRNGFL